MQLPPFDLPAVALALPWGKALGGQSVTAVGLGVATACIGLVAFSFLRKPKKEKVPEDSTPIEEWVEIDPAPHEDAGIDGLLSAVRYPLTERGRLVKALGGEDAEVEIGISRALPAGEVADRCFSVASKFTSKAHVLEALDKVSWITSVMGAVNMAPFPLRSASDLPKALARGYIEGVKVKDLVARLEFPIENASDLLSELSDARFGRAGADGGRGRKADAAEDAEPREESEESAPILAQPGVPRGEKSDAPEEVPV